MTIAPRFDAELQKYQNTRVRNTVSCFYNTPFLNAALTRFRNLTTKKIDYSLISSL